MATHRTHMTVSELAERLGVSSTSNLYRRIKRLGVETATIPTLTNGGVHQVKVVPRDWADALIAIYDTARADAAQAGD